ncbi:unnamed protein product [Ilex paraguariensis]|uniref:Uncharacterized protein n=1 Tax=Ilex paraguariensis TaxID=185542 RepID=A0ABC8RAW5_9AQUA
MFDLKWDVVDIALNLESMALKFEASLIFSDPVVDGSTTKVLYVTRMVIFPHPRRGTGCCLLGYKHWVLSVGCCPLGTGGCQLGTGTWRCPPNVRRCWAQTQALGVEGSWALLGTNVEACACLSLGDARQVLPFAWVMRWALFLAWSTMLGRGALRLEKISDGDTRLCGNQLSV